MFRMQFLSLNLRIYSSFFFMLHLIFLGIESETEVCTAKQVQNNRVFVCKSAR